MIVDQLTELQARIYLLYELAVWYAPAYAQPDAKAAWADVCELLGVEIEAAIERARECQNQLPAEFWSPV